MNSTQSSSVLRSEFINLPFPIVCLVLYGYMIKQKKPLIFTHFHFLMYVTFIPYALLSVVALLEPTTRKQTSISLVLIPGFIMTGTWLLQYGLILAQHIFLFKEINLHIWGIHIGKSQVEIMASVIIGIASFVILRSYHLIIGRFEIIISSNDLLSVLVSSALLFIWLIRTIKEPKLISLEQIEYFMNCFLFLLVNISSQVIQIPQNILLGEPVPFENNIIVTNCLYLPFVWILAAFLIGKPGIRRIFRKETQRRDEVQEFQLAVITVK